MCGYIRDSNIEEVEPLHVKKQFLFAWNEKIQEINESKENFIIKIFNSGSFFDDNEITVDFDYYHSHFEGWHEDPESPWNPSAEQFVKNILEEHVSVISWWLDDQWCGSTQLKAGDLPEQPAWLTAYNHIRIRSWKGSFNADINF